MLGIVIVLLYVVSLPVAKKNIIICSKCYMEFGGKIESS